MVSLSGKKIVGLLFVAVLLVGSMSFLISKSTFFSSLLKSDFQASRTIYDERGAKIPLEMKWDTSSKMSISGIILSDAKIEGKDRNFRLGINTSSGPREISVRFDERGNEVLTLLLEKDQVPGKQNWKIQPLTTVSPLLLRGRQVIVYTSTDEPKYKDYILKLTSVNDLIVEEPIYKISLEK